MKTKTIIGLAITTTAAISSALAAMTINRLNKVQFSRVEIKERKKENVEEEIKEEKEENLNNNVEMKIDDSDIEV